MIISPSTLTKKLHRSSTLIPILTVLNNQLRITKSASKFLNNGDRIQFLKEGDRFVMMCGLPTDTFELHQDHQGGFAINSRPLVTKMREIFKREKPRFKMIYVSGTIIELKLMEE